ncbi:hypothetical protein ACEYW6_29970 [Nostoc sp. UIC 10607]|uniref:hypothetical protein n=1 Tax=Nostoc sp. UIC 10607 TaxID=3045935 RepID=UPI0039A335BC
MGYWSDGVLREEVWDKAGICAIAEIIEPPKIIVNLPNIGYNKKGRNNNRDDVMLAVGTLNFW